MRIVRLTPNAVLPTRANADEASIVLAAAEYAFIEPGAHALVGTGLAIALPPWTVGLVCPRSGLAARHGVTVLNAPGIVDAGYRGEWKVILVNHGTETFNIAPGDRIAQVVITPYLAPTIELVDSLEDTDRGAGGFGSTGR